MRAEIRMIFPVDNMDWDKFVSESKTWPESMRLNNFGWFSLNIGAEGGRGTDIFDILVSTPSAASRARSGKQFEGIIVELFEPEIIANALRERVSAVHGKDWNEIVQQLRRFMHWEYEGMTPL